MSCTLGVAGIERGALPALTFSVGTGGTRLIAEVTDDNRCWRPTYGSAGPLCSSGSLFSPNRYYIGWIATRSGEQPRQEYRKLFELRLPEG